MKRNPQPRLKRFINDVAIHTPFIQMVILLVVLWLLFSAGIYAAELNVDGAIFDSYGEALYWAVAAFTTAGIADSPASGLSKLIGGVWMVIGSTLFFGTIVATVTTYFMKPMQRPHQKIIDAIEYNLENLGELTFDELAVLKDTVDSLIIHVEKINNPKH